jgi:hypothetical protein
MYIFSRRVFDYIPIVSLVTAITNKDEAVVNAALRALQSEGEAPIEKVHTYSLLRYNSMLRRVIKSVPILGNLIVFSADVCAFAHTLFSELKLKKLLTTMGRTSQFEQKERAIEKEDVKWGDIDAAAHLALNCSGSQRAYWLAKGIELGSYEATYELGYFLLKNNHPTEAENIFNLVGISQG